MPDVQILAPGTHPSPLDYVVPGAQEILIKALAANFDGTSAAGAYVPCVELVAPGGIVAATCPLATSVAAGSSADISWFPRGGVGSARAGIQFDTFPQSGDWLYAEATGGSGSPNGYGFDLESTAGKGINLTASGGTPFLGGGIYLTTTGDVIGLSSDSGVIIEDTSDNSLRLLQLGAGGIAIQEAIGADLGGGINVNALGGLQLTNGSFVNPLLLSSPHAGVKILGLPISNVGLAAGSLWNNSGVVNIA